MNFFKCDYDVLDHQGKRVSFSGSWLPIDQFDVVTSYMASLVGYGVKLASIRYYFNEKGVVGEDG